MVVEDSEETFKTNGEIKMDKKIQEKLGSNLITIATYGKENERKVVVVNSLDAITLKQLKPILGSKVLSINE